MFGWFFFFGLVELVFNGVVGIIILLIGYESILKVVEVSFCCFFFVLMLYYFGEFFYCYLDMFV